MDVAIGLPATIPGVEPKAITEWARRAERAGFSSLGVIDRLVYGNHEPLVALTAAAVVSERIRLGNHGPARRDAGAARRAGPRAR